MKKFSLSHIRLKLIHWIKQFVEDPEYKLAQLALRYIDSNRLPDRMYIKYEFHHVFGYPLDLNNPKTFNEKLNWMKLYDRNPLYSTLVDKYQVKEWVAERIGERYIIPTLKVYNHVDEIDFDDLPNQFVLKCTHDSGSVIICTDKSTFDIEGAKAKLMYSLNKNYYLKHREWPYKNVIPRIIAEQYLEDLGQNSLTDYKFFCFNGLPRLMYISQDYQEHPTTDFYDMDFVHLPIKMKDKNSQIPPSKPPQFEEMKHLASILSQGIPIVRVDFYVINGKVFFGEMTFFHNGGYTAIIPSEWNVTIGSWITLQN